MRDTEAATGDRSQGFRTTHIVVPTPTLTPYDPLIERYATRSEVPAELVRAVVQVESGFDPTARSSAGAMGLMQLMPETAAELGVADPYDPADNLRGGITYLKQLLEQYEGNQEIALAAYNAGPGAVERYGNRVPPFAETQSYVRRVRSATDAAARLPAGGKRRYSVQELCRRRRLVDGGLEQRAAIVRSLFGHGRDSLEARGGTPARVSPQTPTCQSQAPSQTLCGRQRSRGGRTATRWSAATRLRQTMTDIRCGTGDRARQRHASLTRRWARG